jgi:hypothetical protein
LYYNAQAKAIMTVPDSSIRLAERLLVGIFRGFGF